MPTPALTQKEKEQATKPSDPPNPTTVEAILDTIIKEYYQHHMQIHDREAQRDNWKDLIFVTEIGTGAAIYMP